MAKPLFGLSPAAQKIVIGVCFSVAVVIMLLTLGVLGGGSKKAPTLSGAWVIDAEAWPTIKKSTPPFAHAAIEGLIKSGLTLTIEGGDTGDFTTKSGTTENKTTYEITYKGKGGILSAKLGKADPIFGDRVNFGTPKEGEGSPDGMIIRWGMGNAVPMKHQ